MGCTVELTPIQVEALVAKLGAAGSRIGRFELRGFELHAMIVKAGTVKLSTPTAGATLDEKENKMTENERAGEAEVEWATKQRAWSIVPPVEPGLYLFADEINPEPTVVIVTRDDRSAGQIPGVLYADGQTAALMDVRWYGPIPAPPEAKGEGLRITWLPGEDDKFCVVARPLWISDARWDTAVWHIDRHLRIGSAMSSEKTLVVRRLQVTNTTWVSQAETEGVIESIVAGKRAAHA